MPLYSLLVAFPTCVLMLKIVRMNECFESVPKRDRDFKCVFPDARASNNLQFLLNNSITLMLQYTGQILQSGKRKILAVWTVHTPVHIGTDKSFHLIYIFIKQVQEYAYLLNLWRAQYRFH